MSGSGMPPEEGSLSTLGVAAALMASALGANALQGVHAESAECIHTVCQQLQEE